VLQDRKKKKLKILFSKKREEPLTYVFEACVALKANAWAGSLAAFVEEAGTQLMTFTLNMKYPYVTDCCMT